MASLYVAKSDALLDALAEAEVSTAVELAKVCGVARNTASAVMAKRAVSLQTTLAIIAGLRARGVRRNASDVFEGAEA